MASVIDDIYDSYGTLELFTNAIERWNVSCMDQLPEYMKLCYEALLDVYEEIEEEMAKQGNSYRVHYAKEAVWQYYLYLSHFSMNIHSYNHILLLVYIYIYMYICISVYGQCTCNLGLLHIYNYIVCQSGRKL
uniref:Terpene synthase metal-binding domain-containing protein n=1 Tax=Davidia involucrata TaxID=16924 RepID=A0A5B7ATX3_DAVIN